MAHAATGETRSRLSPVTTTVVSTISIVLWAVFLHMTRLLTLTADDLLLSIHPVRNSLIVLKARLPVHIGVVRLVPLTRLTAALVGLLLIWPVTLRLSVRVYEIALIVRALTTVCFPFASLALIALWSGVGIVTI
jgi:hypothetical protein